MNLLIVGIGGTFGGIVRYQLGKMISQRAATTFPIGTFLINITGAFCLGLVASAGSGTVYLLLGDGFLGAYTTFSTFMYEGFHLFQGNEKLNALTYIFISLVLGVIGYAAGFALGGLFLK